MKYYITKQLKWLFLIQKARPLYFTTFNFLSFFLILSLCSNYYSLKTMPSADSIPALVNEPRPPTLDFIGVDLKSPSTKKQVIALSPGNSQAPSSLPIPLSLPLSFQVPPHPDIWGLYVVPNVDWWFSLDFPPGWNFSDLPSCSPLWQPASSALLPLAIAPLGTQAPKSPHLTGRETGRLQRCSRSYFYPSSSCILNSVPHHLPSVINIFSPLPSYSLSFIKD